MTNATLQKLQNEIYLAMSETLNDSKLSDLLAKYGLLENGVVNIKLEINKNKIKSNQTPNIDSELKYALDEISETQISILGCCYCPLLCCRDGNGCTCCN
jgi:aldehyde:ferredoxin oxidoreductase